MAAYNGEPIGIECLMGDRERWAFVVPEMSGDDRQWRVQYFDADGFVGHSCYETLPLAVETVIQEGYRTPDPGALDRISRTPRWALGVKKAAIHQRCQQQMITFSQMIAEMKALEAEGI
ncbi:hypothetical protein [Ralstonia pseudosolanacearum]|uniref:hypothetical protein n=1 Tax=Ralstonia pseudosolanacearum TaxID=1310165 RepID=UPI003CF38671